jgi:hypothetical protein
VTLWQSPDVLDSFSPPQGGNNDRPLAGSLCFNFLPVAAVFTIVVLVHRWRAEK